MSDRHSQESHGGYGVYVLTWLALVILTAITVAVAGMNLGKISVLTAVLIASLKATLVLSFFMHLRYERPLFTIMFLVVIVVLAIFIGLTFFDPLFR